MAKATNRRGGKGPPDPRDSDRFSAWLEKQPREWFVVIAARAASRVLPLLAASKRFPASILPVFRATAISQFAAKYPNREIARRAAAYAAAAAAAAADAAAADAAAIYDAVRRDAQRLHKGTVTAEQLSAEQLWPNAAFPFSGQWQETKRRLHADGRHWRVWIDWYDNAVLQQPYFPISEAQEAAFTDLPGELPWKKGAEAVNAEIARRLEALKTGVDDQRQATAAGQSQLTVMSTDLVGMTALISRFDPEELREVTVTYQERITGIVAQFNGFVARYMGDGLLIYFGHPQAREDDAERAVRAALAMINSVRDLTTTAVPTGTLSCRVGIATGPVVGDQVIEFGSSLESAASGRILELAIRLRSIAEPGTVVISEATRSRIGELFEYKPVDPVKLKGMLASIQAWAVVSEEESNSTFKASHSDPAPIEGVPSPIEISRRPDGRIGAEAGAFDAPTLPAPLTPLDHTAALAACRKRAEQLQTTAASPRFQWGPGYAEALAAYLDWLPLAPGIGNILLADGEARILNKLFAADEGILPTGFAGRLSVLLEDHIALRTHYPELERHYHAVRTGRVDTPLSRDAVEGIRQVIHTNTPGVFHESVSPAMDETSKPVPQATPLEDTPPADASRPKPPKDPIAEVDPGKSRNFIFASAANRIWEILKKGKDVQQGVEGWQKTYDQFRPFIGPVLDWLKYFSSGASG